MKKICPEDRECSSYHTLWVKRNAGRATLAGAPYKNMQTLITGVFFFRRGKNGRYILYLKDDRFSYRAYLNGGYYNHGYCGCRNRLF